MAKKGQSTEVVVKLPRPHSPEQESVVLWDGSQVVFAGRRWGKTQAGVLRILRWSVKDPGLYWWVGVSWQSASMKRAWRLLKGYVELVCTKMGLDPQKYVREVVKELRTPWGSEIWLRTAERESSLAGEGVRGMVVDEFTLMREKVWYEYLEPTLLDYGGWALLIGVPKGPNWGARLWTEAKGQEAVGWRALQFTTYQNPLIPQDRLDRLRERLPERVFRQEILAEIVSWSGAVFRGVEEAVGAEPQERRKEGHRYVFGVDWGKYEDYTVVAVIDVTEGALVHLDRSHLVSYELQKSRLQDLYHKFLPETIVVERNAMGDPLADSLRAEGLPVQPLWTTAGLKQNLIEGLALALERQELKILEDPVLLQELQVFEAKTTSMGLKYGAPEGFHDDCVMALALAWSAVGRTFGFVLPY